MVKMSKNVIACTACGRKNTQAMYDFEKKQYTCSVCGNIDGVEPVQKTCKKCGAVYDEYTWFDPKRCPECGKVFSV